MPTKKKKLKKSFSSSMVYSSINVRGFTAVRPYRTTHTICGMVKPHPDNNKRGPTAAGPPCAASHAPLILYQVRTQVHTRQVDCFPQ